MSDAHEGVREARADEGKGEVDSFPLSSAQERLWFTERLTPGSPLFHIAGAVHLAGPIDASALAAALADLVARHESLRTSFVEDDGEARQRVHDVATIALVRDDLRDPRSGRADPGRIRAALEAEAVRPFDLAAPPLLRARLLHTNEGHHVLALVIHHLVADGWSLGVLLGELGALYQAHRSGDRAALPALEIQYVDYAVWQRERVAANEIADGIAAWTERLAGAPARLVLPGARAPTEVSAAGAIRPLDLGAGLSHAVREFARGETVTQFVALLAGLQAALARFTGERDIMVGSPVSGRDLPESQPVVGLFVNLIALRTRIDDRQSFRQLVRSVRDTVVDTQADQHVPFEEVVRALGRGGPGASSPLVQVVFTWQAGLTTELALGDVRGRGELIPTGTAKFDLTLSLDDLGGSIAGWVEYRTDLYDAHVVDRLCACLVQLLAAAVARPDEPVGALDLVAGEERERLLRWSRGPAAAPFASVLASLAVHVAARPDAHALEHADQRVTYGELDRQSDRLAHHLIELGVGREAVVGLLMDRSAAAIIAMVAAWKAGAAYLPLDPTHPAERLRYMIADAGIAVVCADPEYGARFEGELAVVTVDQATLADGGAPARSAPRPTGSPGPDDLAYIIYTSGSTGRPKGVEVTHRGLANLSRWHGDRLRLGERASQVTSLSFDASVLEIAGALVAGATLCIAPADARAMPSDLRDWTVQSAIDVCFVPTPVAEAMLALDWPESARLRLFLTGGDRLQARPRAGSHFTLINNYGPTEITVVSTAGPVEPGGDAAPSIGRPIQGNQVYLLDDHLHLVPAGAVGQITIGGDGLARGYRRRPALTAERFVPDPFADRPGARLYRTGDLASFGPAGELLFRGRTDEQVKLRGQRIELGEVAALLEEWPAVARAYALIRRGDPRAEPALAAYLVPRPGRTVEAAALRHQLRQRLPEAMVPSYYFTVDELPLTANGKVDREALLRLEPAPAAPPARPPGSGSPAEELVHDVWAALFGDGVVIDADSDFFELGGHSLLAAQMIGRLREAFGRDIPLRWAFEAPTVRALTARLAGPASVASAAAPPSPRPIERRERLVLSSAQERLWFLDQFTGSGGAYNIAGALRLTGALDAAALARSLAAMAARHEMLRTRFDQIAGVPHQRVVADAALELVQVDLREPVSGRADPTRVAAELERESSAGFDLTRAPLARARLYLTGPDEHVLGLIVHHIAADGWSIGVIMRELLALYGAFRAGSPSPLAPLDLQYADYAAWQRERLASGALEDDLAYWESRLAGATALALPSSGHARTEASYRGATVRRELAPELGRALRELGRQGGVTLFMTLLAGTQAVLARATGQDDIVVGTDVAGRSRAALEPLVGLFVNQLVLRSDLGGDPGFRTLLTRVRSVVLEAWAHQDVPFNTLVDRLRPARELGRNPLFQVMVILQDELPSALDLGGVIAQPVELDAIGSVFDLSLAFRPRTDGAITASLRHATHFGRGRAERLLADLHAALESVAGDPDAPLSSLEVQRFDRPAPVAPARSRLDGLRAARPRAIALTPSELVAFAPLAPDQSLPLVVTPTSPDVDLAAWSLTHRDLLAGCLDRVGALLFRGFDGADLAAFRAVVAAISVDLIQYGERSSPRTQLEPGIYTSTDHPPDQPILLHNEQSYTLSWPGRIWFSCLEPPAVGGRTPIADSRRVLARLRPSTVARFAAQEVLYVRNYGEGLGLPWTEAFQTADRRAVEEHCRRASILIEWKGRDRLRTSQVRPAIRLHPRTGVATWFNHVLFFHSTSLPAEVAAAVGPDEVPYNTFYGDGSPIAPDVLAELRAAYAAETQHFDWRRGDILLLDNMVTAHGREPFAGPRRIVVAMTDPITAPADQDRPRSDR